MVPEILFSSYEDQPEHSLTYAIIGARYHDKWIFVYHNRRQNWGMPAGHIESGERPAETAERELVEETGAISYLIEPVATYTVIRNGIAGSGKLFYAIVSEIGEIIDREEIGDIMLSDKLPGDIAFPEVHRSLFDFLERYHQNRGANNKE